MVHKVLGKLCLPFFLALSEINATLGKHQFGGVDNFRPMLDSRILLSRDLIDNPYLRQDDLTSKERYSKRDMNNDRHILIKLPLGEYFNGKQFFK